MTHTYTLTLPDGSCEKIPDGLCPIRRSGEWVATSMAVTIGDLAGSLATAEQEAEGMLKRRDYLRGLMGRVLAPGK